MQNKSFDDLKTIFGIGGEESGEHVHEKIVRNLEIRVKKRELALNAFLIKEFNKLNYKRAMCVARCYDVNEMILFLGKWKGVKVQDVEKEERVLGVDLDLYLDKNGRSVGGKKGRREEREEKRRKKDGKEKEKETEVLGIGEGVKMCCEMCNVGISDAFEYSLHLQKSVKSKLKGCINEAQEIKKGKMKDQAMEFFKCYETLLQDFDIIQDSIKNEFSNYV